ncbi:MAG: LysR family transcriptional regulator [Pseudomonadota bacterium]
MNALPLQQLQAFEAAARRRSFTTAASDLNVQQPAISRQVAALEAQLGTRLFLRTKPRLTLTAEGAALYRVVDQGFDAIRAEMRSLSASAKDGPIVVNAAIGFTSLYLMPRLAAFQAAHPDLPVQIVTRDQNTGFRIEDADIVVTFGETGLPDCQSGVIFGEELVPICAPSLLENGRKPTLEELPQRRLLHMSSPEHADDWARYFDGLGFEARQPDPTDRIMSYMVYLSSIQNGAGIGLGWRGLIERDLEENRLVIANDRVVATGRGYHANLTPRAFDDQNACIFWGWCCAA